MSFPQFGESGDAYSYPTDPRSPNISGRPWVGARRMLYSAASVVVGAELELPDGRSKRSVGSSLN
jgi:hypothetical protein